MTVGSVCWVEVVPLSTVRRAIRRRRCQLPVWLFCALCPSNRLCLLAAFIAAFAPYRLACISTHQSAVVQRFCWREASAPESAAIAGERGTFQMPLRSPTRLHRSSTATPPVDPVDANYLWLRDADESGQEFNPR
jgi:hypothetical protein